MARTSLGLGLGLSFVKSILSQAIDAILSLFENGEQGLYYNIQDTSTLFQDAIGSTAAVVNQPVGLVLDSKTGINPGPEILTNGGFDSATGWTLGTGWSISGGRAIHSGGTAAYLNQGTPTAGKTYLCVVDVAVADGSNFPQLYLGNTPTVSSMTAPGVYTFRAVAQSGSLGFAIRGVGNCEVNSFSVKELPGNHASQNTTASKPLLRGTPLVTNALTNGDFSQGATNWSFGSGWAISGGKANATLSSTVLVDQSVNIFIGRVYRLIYTISNYSAGQVTPTIGSAVGTSQAANGTYSQYFTTASTTRLSFNAGGGGFTGSIDDVILSDVSDGAVQAPYFLQFDGFDDYLSTSSIDFTATDKITVFAGLRKLVDTASIITELSSSVTSNAGSFYIAAHDTGGREWSSTSRGSASATTTQAAYDTTLAPDTAVLSSTHDIAGDLSTLRRNGIDGTSGVQDKGTGNFGNYPIYIGRRGGTSVPFNGHLYTLVIRSANTDSTTIAAAETQINTYMEAY